MCEMYIQLCVISVELETNTSILSHYPKLSIIVMHSVRKIHLNDNIMSPLFPLFYYIMLYLSTIITCKFNK